MKQLSQKGYRTAEPFLGELEQNEIVLNSNIVEEILNLPEGYLCQNDSKGEVIELQRKWLVFRRNSFARNIYKGGRQYGGTSWW